LIEIATTLPDGWLVDLHQAARRADREWVCQLLAMLEDAHNDVYQMLMDWVTTFQFDQLMRLTTSEEPL
jgi:hypothetical protein